MKTANLPKKKKILLELYIEQIEQLDKICAANKLSRAELIRNITDIGLKTYKNLYTQSNIRAGLGLWGDNKIDGLAYQEKVRKEWE